MMTVKQLITKLQKMDPDRIVVVYGQTDGPHKINSIGQLDANHNPVYYEGGEFHPSDPQTVPRWIQRDSILIHCKKLPLQ